MDLSSSLLHSASGFDSGFHSASTSASFSGSHSGKGLHGLFEKVTEIRVNVNKVVF